MVKNQHFFEIAQNDQNFIKNHRSRKMSYGGVRGCKMGLLGPKNPKILFPGRSRPYFRPNRPIFMIRYPADSAGNMAGSDWKIICLDSMDPADPFCTLEHLHNSFCDDFEVIWRFGNFRIFQLFCEILHKFLTEFSAYFRKFSTKQLSC
jgi:hypothetical protein